MRIQSNSTAKTDFIRDLTRAAGHSVCLVSEWYLHQQPAKKEIKRKYNKIKIQYSSQGIKKMFKKLKNNLPTILPTKPTRKTNRFSFQVEFAANLLEKMAATFKSKKKSNKGKSSSPRPQSEKHRQAQVHPQQDDGLETTSTRVCIKGVPPSFTSIQLRDFLMKEFKLRQQKSNDAAINSNLVITDCRVLFSKDKTTSRRIAFAGFQTAEMARSVIKLFDRSFALTSRLSVEPALNNHLKNKEDDNKLEKKKEPQNKEEEKENKEAKDIAKELVAVGANKAKFWATDLVPATSYAPEGEATSHQMITKEAGKAENQRDNESVSSSEAENYNKRDDSGSDSEDDDADPLANAKPKPSVVSDMDFLRSKQKMVDNLEEDDRAEMDIDQEGVEKEEDAKKDDSDSSDVSDESSTSSVPAPKLVPEKMKSVESNDSDIKGDKGRDEDSSDEEDNNKTSDRLFVRNLPFTTTEEDLEEHFSKFGNVVECHIPVDDRKMSKGFAFVAFDNAFDASRALAEVDGADFQGRFLHIMASQQKPQASAETEDEANRRPLSYKERQELARRQDATKTSKGWSASFVRGDAVVDSLADRLGIKKGDILNVKGDLKSGDAAVRLALGETQVIEENREYFKKHGIDMEALVSANRNSKESVKRSNSSILIKNLPYDTLIDELQKVFHGVGDPPTRILLPPSRTIALVEYTHSSDAKRAFRRLAYKRFKNVPLYLEWAPLAASQNPPQASNGEGEEEATEVQLTKSKEVVPETEEEPVVDGPAPSIYIKNLNFSTTEEQLKKVFEKHANDVRAVNIPKKLAPLKKPKFGGGNEEEMKPLSMGFGFVEFGSQESTNIVLKKLQGTMVDGHALELKPSTKSITTRAVKPATSKNPLKMVVRNVPFQATRTELLKLFGSFGQLKRVRVPKKFDGGHRGFAFVEFVTHKEALAAMKALSRTHLYGRHLVLEWAEDDGDDVAALRDKAQKDVSQAGSNKRQRIS